MLVPLWLVVCPPLSQMRKLRPRGSQTKGLPMPCSLSGQGFKLPCTSFMVYTTSRRSCGLKSIP